MYTYHSAIGLNGNTNGKLIPVNILNLPLSAIYEMYQEVYVFLTLSDGSIEVTLDLNVLPSKTKLNGSTLEEWLIANDNNALPTTDGFSKFKNVYVSYKDLTQWNFDIKLGHHLYHPDMELNEDRKEDLIITKSDVNYEDMYKSTLVVVNGLVHKSDYVSDYLIALGAGTNVRCVDKMEVGVLDFHSLGGIEVVDITRDDIYKHNQDIPYSAACYIKSPTSFVGKTVLLCLGGHLITKANAITVVGDDAIKLNSLYYAWVNRYFDTLGQLDLPTKPNEQGMVVLDDLMSDQGVADWFDLSNTFLVVIDNPNVRVVMEDIHYSGLYGTYQTGESRNYPIALGGHKLANYIRREEHGLYALFTGDSGTDNRTLETTKYLDNTVVANVLETAQPKKVPHGAFVIITSNQREE